MKSVIQGAALAALFLFLVPCSAHAQYWVQGEKATLPYATGTTLAKPFDHPGVSGHKIIVSLVIIQSLGNSGNHVVVTDSDRNSYTERFEGDGGAGNATNSIWESTETTSNTVTVTATITAGSGGATNKGIWMLIDEYQNIGPYVQNGSGISAGGPSQNTSAINVAANHFYYLHAGWQGSSCAVTFNAPTPTGSYVNHETNPSSGSSLGFVAQWDQNLSSAESGYVATVSTNAGCAGSDANFAAVVLDYAPAPAPPTLAYWTDTIRDFSGQAVQNTLITVCALGASGIPCAPALQRTNTDALGNFHLVIASGNYVICAGTGNLPFNALCWNQTIGGAGGGGTLTGNGTPCMIAKWAATTQLGNSTGCDDGINPVTWPNGLSLVSNALYIQKPNANPGTVANELVKLNSSGQAVAAGTSDTTNIFGIAGPGAGNSGNVSIAVAGQIGCVFDNQTAVQDWVVASTTVGGDCHDAGSTEATGVQNFARVATVNGGAGTQAIVDLYTPDVVGAGGSGLIDPALRYSGAYYVAPGTAAEIAGVSPPTTPNVSFQWCSTPSGGVATAPTWCIPGVPVNAQTGTTYTILATDREKLITATNSAAQAYTLPQAGSTGFDRNFNVAIFNRGTGTVTVTPTTSTINGAANLAIPAGQTAYIYSDNTNYVAVLAGASLHACTFVIPGTGTSGVLQNSDIGPTLDQDDCMASRTGVVLEIDVTSDAGTPNIIIGRDRAGTVTNLVSGALAANARTKTCSNTGGTLGIDGSTTCSATLQNTGINAGDYFGAVSGTAGGVAKSISVTVVWTQ